MRIIVLAILIISASSGFSQTAYTWKNVQILAGGLVSGIEFNPAQKDVVYARTDVGGAYRWNVSDSSWTPLNDDISSAESNYTGIISMAVDPSNANRIYLANGLYTASWAGTGAIYASSDKGTTWTRSLLSIKLGGNENGRTAGERLAVDPNLGSKLYLGSSADGLWTSSDYAVTWSKVASFPVATTPAGNGGFSFVLFDKSSGTSGSATPTIYAGILQTGTSIYKSTNGGTSWTAVAAQPTTQMPHHARLASNGMLYVTYSDAPGPNGIAAGSVWKLNTGTGAWTNISPPAGQGGYGGVSVDPTNPNILVVSTMDRWFPRDEILRSIDGGSTWKSLLATASYNRTLAPYTSNSSPHWVGDVEIDPFNRDKAIFITGYGIWVTYNLTAADANNPTTWSFQEKGLEETVPGELISPPTGAPLVSVIGDIDGFKHDNIDISPAAGRHAPNFGTNTSIDYAELSSSFMTRTYNSGTYGSYSNDGGTSWTAFGAAPTGTSSGGNLAVAANGSRLVWSPGGASMSYSTNNGSSWNTSTGIGTGLEPVSDRVNPLKFYVYDAANGNVLSSTDGGVSFSVKTSGLPTVPSYLLWQTGIRTVFGMEGEIWLCHTGGLYHSTNSGTSFTKLSNVQDASKVGFGKAAPTKTYPSIYIVGTISGTYGFYRSDDAGATWIRINDNKHQFGSINTITGDPRIYGRVYMSTGGRGIIYGDIPVTTPLNLLDFYGTWEDQQAILSWDVTEEKDVDGYELWRSTDPASGSWTQAGFTASLNTYSFQHYQFEDLALPGSSVIYYKLIARDKDGSRTESRVISLYAENNSIQVHVYPNPSSSYFQIHVTRQDTLAIHYKIINLCGQIVEENTNAGSSFACAQGLTAGIYFLWLQSGDQTKTVKIIKE
ncbi:MAG: T9SS type A sorting domain-containing protein [Cytophagaceae bacterium]